MALLKPRAAAGVVALPSPQRVALMHAIKAHTAAAAGLGRVEEAGRGASEKVWTLTDAMTKAAQVLADAPAEMGAYVFAGADSGPIPVSKQVARATQTEAEAALQDARDYREAMRAALAYAQSEVTNAATALDRAALAVVVAEAADRAVTLAAETTKLCAEALEKGAALAWLFRAGAVPNAYDDGAGGRADMARDPAIQEALSQHRALYQPAFVGEWGGAAVAAGVTPWAAALAALKRDAAAPLPL